MKGKKTMPKKLYTNQKGITIHKTHGKLQKTLENEEERGAVINIAAMRAASRNLSAGAFNLWCYFAIGSDGWHFGLSSKDVEKTFGIKIKQYNNAIHELTEKGYLVQNEGAEYDFYDTNLMPLEDKVSNNENENLMPKGNKVLENQNQNLMPLEDKVFQNLMPLEDNTLCPKGITNKINKVGLDKCGSDSSLRSESEPTAPSSSQSSEEASEQSEKNFNQKETPDVEASSADVVVENKFWEVAYPHLPVENIPPEYFRRASENQIEVLFKKDNKWHRFYAAS